KRQHKADTANKPFLLSMLALVASAPSPGLRSGDPVTDRKDGGRLRCLDVVVVSREEVESVFRVVGSGGQFSDLFPFRRWMVIEVSLLSRFWSLAPWRCEEVVVFVLRSDKCGLDAEVEGTGWRAIGSNGNS
ncbi:unnamed protein product, partial [Brassica rapa]